MNKEMIISSNGHETRVAILEDDQLAELFVEREQNRGVVGNVYKGRVSKVLPGMQSSFVDIGLERDAFLYVSEVVTPAEFDRLEGAEEDDAPVIPLPVEIPDTVLVEAGGAAEAPQIVGPERAAERRAKDRDGGRGHGRDDRDRPEARIEDLLKEGQEVLVQVVKEPLGTKGARLTS